jgi:hypothetical protein
MEPKATLVYGNVGPDSRDEISFADNFTSMFGKDDENVQRAPAQVNVSASFLEQPLGRK